MQRARPKGRRREEKEKDDASGTQSRYLFIILKQPEDSISVLKIFKTSNNGGWERKILLSTQKIIQDCIGSKNKLNKVEDRNTGTRHAGQDETVERGANTKSSQRLRLEQY